MKKITPVVEKHYQLILWMLPKIAKGMLIKNPIAEIYKENWAVALKSAGICNSWLIIKPLVKDKIKAPKKPIMV